MPGQRTVAGAKGKDNGKTFSLVEPSDAAFEGSVPERPGFAFEKNKTSTIARQDSSRHHDKIRDTTKAKRDKDMLSNGRRLPDKTRQRQRQERTKT